MELSLQSYIPPIRKRYPNIFPSIFETATTQEDFKYLKTFNDEPKAKYFEGTERPMKTPLLRQLFCRTCSG